MSSIPLLTNEDFQKEVVESSLPVLIDFWAVWCGPCQMFAPVVEAIAEKYGDKLKVLKVDTDAQPELAEKFEVMSIPTLALLRGGETIATVSGALPRNMVENWLKEQGI